MVHARKLLYPFSLLYGGVMSLRNRLYNEGILDSKPYPVPVIAVGNLSVGGTGKSPMVEYLIALLKEDFRVATLSRGYKRSTKGFLLVSGEETAGEVGDEPLQFKSKFPDILVAVDEERRHGIEELLNGVDPPDVILLDDAFQHRKVRAGLYMLLTPYGNLYSDDLVLPAGNLREPRSGAKRADIVVVTKCPKVLGEQEQVNIRERLGLLDKQLLFFSRIAYHERVMGAESLPLSVLQKHPFTLVTGIANPKPLVRYLKAHHLKFDHIAFPDHHNFTGAELRDLRSKELILTTEKDYMRLRNELPEDILYYLPIKTRFLNREGDLQRAVQDFVQKK